MNDLLREIYKGTVTTEEHIEIINLFFYTEDEDISFKEIVEGYTS